jgi:hypothetical protein
MNGRTWTAKSLPLGLLLVALGVPCATAGNIGEIGDAPQAGATAGYSQATTAAEKPPPAASPEAKIVGDPQHPDAPAPGSFAPDPVYPDPYDAEEQLKIYSAKHMNRTANPPVMLGLRLYDRGAFAPPPTLLGDKNPVFFHFMAYGDVRVGAADNDAGIAAANGKTDQSLLATRLNLDLDLTFTATERIHAFMDPFGNNPNFTRYDISGKVSDKFVQEFNSKLDTLFFEGDLGNMLSGLTDKPSTFDLPISFGLVPILTQNGIWIQDEFRGLAAGITAKHSGVLDISNFDLTFFSAFNGVTTAAVPGRSDTKLFALAGFFDTLRGYVEAGYGYVDAADSELSYNNLTVAYTRRYWNLVSNSIRLIGNFGQTAPVKTANGLLVLAENSLLTSKPSTLVPYLNLFGGFGTPQSLARDIDAGGVLRNTGINFQGDGLTGYPTLDALAHDTYGGALGVEYLFNLDRQLVVEGTVVERMGGSVLPGSEYSLGALFQQPLSNADILIFQGMRGWLEGQRDIFGVRVELRHKF